MNALKKLGALAEPDLGPDAAFTLDARIWGLLIAAFGFVAALATISGLLGDGDQGRDPRGVAYLLIGATLPAVFAVYGGLRLFLGDARGKRAVVFAIALGYLYLVSALLRMRAGPCGEGQGICEAAKFMFLLVAIPGLTGAAYLLYRLVGSLRYGGNARGQGAVVSWIVTLLACVAFLSYAHGLLAQA